MKKFVLCTLTVLMTLASCSKKINATAARPYKPYKRDTITSSLPKTEPEPTVTESVATATVTAPPPAPMMFTSPLIVIDESGKVITTREQLPVDIAEKVDYKKITRAFTPAQRQNLITRFKMVPPKVLFIPDQLTSKSTRGTYIIYKKKFYYWKKDDGLFYLDDTYYQ